MMKPAKLGVRAKIILAAIGTLAVAAVIGIIVYYAGAAAIVNGQRISRSEFYRETLDRAGAEVLDELITNRLIEQEAAKNHVKIDPAAIDQQLEKEKTMYAGGDEQVWQAILTQYGWTEQRRRIFIRNFLIAEQIIGKDITISDDDIKTYYEQHKSEYAEAEQVRASHILVNTKEEADAILAQLKGGADFAAIAKEKSLDTQSKDKGGDLGYFGRGEMDPDFEKAAFSLPVGQLSDPVKTAYGYHIIKVTDHKQAHEYTLDEVKDRVRQDLLDSLVNERFDDWVAGLKAKAKIVQYWKK